MRRDQLEHIIRAAAAVINEREVVVIGSQAILGSYADGLPPEVTKSVEADVFPIEDPDGRKTSVIDGAIGEDSPFHETFGVYAHGVSQRTARLPGGWRDRLIPVCNENTNGVTGWCLERHDLWIAKLLAGRPHDLVFCRALLAADLVNADALRGRLEATEATEHEHQRAHQLIG